MTQKPTGRPANPRERVATCTIRMPQSMADFLEGAAAIVGLTMEAYLFELAETRAADLRRAEREARRAVGGR